VKAGERTEKVSTKRMWLSRPKGLFRHAHVTKASGFPYVLVLQYTFNAQENIHSPRMIRTLVHLNSYSDCAIVVAISSPQEARKRSAVLNDQAARSSQKLSSPGKELKLQARGLDSRLTSRNKCCCYCSQGYVATIPINVEVSRKGIQYRWQEEHSHFIQNACD
jgi:hypothetical protein